MGQDSWSGLGVGPIVEGCRERGIRPCSVPWRVPARQLHIKDLGAFTALHRSEGVPERGLQHSAARGALELEGHLIGHRNAFKPAPSETVTRLLRDPVCAPTSASSAAGKARCNQRAHGATPVAKHFFANSIIDRFLPNRGPSPS